MDRPPASEEVRVIETRRSARAACVFFSALILLFPAHAAATWNLQGNAVCTAAGAQILPSAIADGAGGMIVTWLDARPGTPGIYAQRLLGDGTIAPGWPSNGVLCSGTSTTGPPGHVPDGAGGVLVVWLGGSTVYAQRIDATGAIHAGWPADGKVLVINDCTMPHGFAVVTDGAGGAYFTRAHAHFCLPNQEELRLTRITSDGNFAPGWSLDGVGLASSYTVSLDGLVPDPTGGVVCATRQHSDGPVSDYNFGSVVRVRPDATVAFAKTSPAYYSGGLSPGGIMQVAAAPDGAGGAFSTWHDSASPASGDFGQHLGPTGTYSWSEPYVVPFSERVVQDGSLGVWLAGRPPGSSELQVHRRLADGTLPAGWTGAGVTVTASASLQSYATAPLSTALLLCRSENGAGGNRDLFALSVEREGVITPGWNPGGTPLCTAVGDQINPFLLLDGAGGVLACWEDQRPGASAADIYAARIELPPPVGVGPAAARTFGFFAVGPDPARDRIDLTFGLGGEEPATLEMVDVAGRLLRRVALAGGSRTASLAVGDLANGVYFVRLIQATRAATTRFAVAR
jgi:hypothetical protein